MLGENGDAWLSRLHMQLARELRGQGWSQMNIAAMLGTTQSTISRQYQKPVTSLPGSADELAVDGWAKEIAGGLLSVGQNEELLRQRFIVEFQFTGNQVLRFDKTLTGLDLEVDQNEHALIRRLEWAIGRLDARTIMPVLPNVGMNIAACLQTANSVDEVAAVPGKITSVDGELRTHGKPQFGSSKHLAELLLEARNIDASKSAIINIRPPGDYEGTDIDAVQEACNQLGWKLADADRNGLENPNSNVDVILDIGDFGWEPSLYVLGQSPLEVVDRCHTLVKTLEGMD
ncbi:MAG: thiamine-phosphate synthase family protein [Candidatus Thermoplasmatota archaeon]|nr:thiamine-phosphate synthase family protein [Candidatus Thermoplasmatota archaeon]